nr:ROK family protein [uncultured bacterium]
MVAQRSVSWEAERPASEEASYVADVALGLIKEHAGEGHLVAAGVSLAALVDAEGAVVKWPNRPAWRGLPVRSILEARLAVPVVIEDDANAAALAEATLGAGRDFRDVLVLMVGTGVGAGLILDGRLHRGRNGWAGELGHVVMQPGGPDCSCGKRGCLQVLSSGRALDHLARARGLDGAAQLAEAAERGELWAREALAASGRWLGLAAANVIDLLDLDAVVVGGGLSGLGAPWWSTLEETLRSNVLNAEHRQIALRRAEMPDAAGLLGAVIRARQVTEHQTHASTARHNQ